MSRSGCCDWLSQTAVPQADTPAHIVIGVVSGESTSARRNAPGCRSLRVLCNLGALELGVSADAVAGRTSGSFNLRRPGSTWRADAFAASQWSKKTPAGRVWAWLTSPQLFPRLKSRTCKRPPPATSAGVGRPGCPGATWRDRGSEGARRWYWATDLGQCAARRDV